MREHNKDELQLSLLQKVKSDYADIRFYETEDKRLVLTLDSFIQFVEGEDEKIYHETLLESPLQFNNEATEFLILGGGDGLLARDIIKWNKNVEITLVDIDKEMISLAKNYDRLVELNENSLEKDNCNVIIADAGQWVQETDEEFDIIICDLPDPNSKELLELYTKDFYSNIANILSPNGVIGCQCHDNIAYEVAGIFEEILDESYIYEYEMPFLSTAQIVVGVKNAE